MTNRNLRNRPALSVGYACVFIALGFLSAAEPQLRNANPWLLEPTTIPNEPMAYWHRLAVHFPIAMGLLGMVLEIRRYYRPQLTHPLVLSIIWGLTSFFLGTIVILLHPGGDLFGGERLVFLDRHRMAAWLAFITTIPVLLANLPAARRWSSGLSVIKWPSLFLFSLALLACGYFGGKIAHTTL